MIEAKFLDITPAQYHEDPCEVPSLSVSIAKLLLNRSPLHAYHAHPKLGNGHRTASASQDRGSIIHKLLLGRGAEIEIVHANDFKTKAAQEQRDAAIEAGRIPVIEGKFGEMQRAASVIYGRIQDLGINLYSPEYIAECAITWTEPGAKGDVVCRGMLDLFSQGAVEILDVKSCEDASPEKCAAAIWRYGYHIQDAAYSRAVTAAIGEPASFTFLFVELEAPYGVLPATCSAMFKMKGQIEWLKAVKMWDECLTSGNWPGYATARTRLEPPAWSLSKMEDN